MLSQSVNIGIPSPKPYGLCLFLGPGGERCFNPAREDGFCSEHGESGEVVIDASWFRRGAALILLVVFLWVVFAGFLRELADWLR